MCKGNLVQSGVTRQDLSNKYYSQLPDEEKKSPSRNHHPFISIPEPSIEEFYIKFNITKSMVPGCRVLAYYVRSDRETVGDSMVYPIDDQLENQVRSR